MGRKSVIQLKEEQSPYADAAEEASMVRTQLYLTREEHAFVQQEGRRVGKPMAAVVRQWIDEKMEVQPDAWEKSGLLDPPAASFDGPKDAAINHDHYIYGGPKKYKKVKGKWVLQEPLS
jgi:hypothetical protein